MWRSRPACKARAVLAIALMGLTTLGPADPRLPTTKGFVVTQFVTAMYEGKTGRTAAWDKSDGLPECPEGYAPALDADQIMEELKVPAAERVRLKRPENFMALGRRLLHRGPLNTDVCEYPQSVPDPGFKTIKGKVAYGLDLDGSDGTGALPAHICPHGNFVGPSGEKGIDNQLYRALGCIKGRRQGSLMHGLFNAQMRQGEYTILIELTAVDDLENDTDIAVGFFSSQDAMVNNVDGVSLTNTSLRVHHDRHYRAVTRGKIVNGVVTTEPVDVHLKSSLGVSNYYFRDARFRGKIQPDGSLKGILAGYQEVATVYWDVAQFGVLSENEIHGPMSCPGLYYALQRLADAYPDPLGGPCAWISSAYELEAVPAFVIHVKR